MSDSDFQATYSPEDNKLRLRSAFRLPPDLYQRVKACGFIWAAKQGFFVAPAWSPEAKDLLLELCGDIDDEDTTLVERAEERAERFEVYRDKRAADAVRAHEAVEAITSGIPMGQPILIGHHSERHARKDKERIDSGMAKAVRMWDTSQYWKSRAAGALRHAKYKERADVRARRIKKLEADKRKHERNKADAQRWLKFWSIEGLTEAQAYKLSNVCHLVVERRENGNYWTAFDVLRPAEERYSACPSYTVAQVQEVAKRHYPSLIAYAERWIAHLDNRLIYERAMLDEQGASDLLKPAPRPKQLPLCNYRAPDGITVDNSYGNENVTYPQVDMTQAEYARIDTNYKGTRVVGRSHRVRVAIVKSHLACVFITASKTHARPADVEKAPRILPPPRMATYVQTPRERTPFDAMREILKGGGAPMVIADQLYPTPSDLAERMAGMAMITTATRVLDPNAGTGALLDAAGAAGAGDICAVEINAGLCDRLSSIGYQNVHCVDFLECTPERLGSFDVILMNPPFSNNQAAEHLSHALRFLAPGGRLVAVMPAGFIHRDDNATRALRERLGAMGADVEQLPPGSFAHAGTQVNTVLVSLQLSN